MTHETPDAPAPHVVRMRMGALERLVFFVTFFFVPVPIFLDGRTLRFYWEAPFTQFNGVPIPIGMLSLGIYYVYAFQRSITGSTYRGITGGSSRAVFWTFAIAIGWFYFVAELGILQVVQLVMPALLVLFLRLPTDPRKYRIATRFVFAGALTFGILHFVSIFLYAKDVTSPDVYEFARFFSGSVYQSHVTYPGVLFLYGIVSIQLFIESAFRRINVLYLASAIGFVLLASLAYRRVTAIDLAVLVLTPTLYTVVRVLTKGKFSKSLALILLAFAALFLLFTNPAITRAAHTTDIDRLQIWRRLLVLVLGNPLAVLWGVRGATTGGLHNYVFDIVFRAGLIGLILVAAPVVILMRRLWANSGRNVSSLHFFRSPTTLRNLFRLAAASSLLTNNAFNSSFTQPYYLVNCLVLLVFVFAPVGIARGEPKRSRTRTAESAASEAGPGTGLVPTPS